MEAVLSGFFALGRRLTKRGALVQLVQIPEFSGSKIGLDDWLVLPNVVCKQDWTRLARLDEKKTALGNVGQQVKNNYSWSLGLLSRSSIFFFLTSIRRLIKPSIVSAG